MRSSEYSLQPEKILKKLLSAETVSNKRLLVFFLNNKSFKITSETELLIEQKNLTTTDFLRSILTQLTINPRTVNFSNNEETVRHKGCFDISLTVTGLQ